jgi:hypothetical protein
MPWLVSPEKRAAARSEAGDRITGFVVSGKIAPAVIL